ERVPQRRKTKASGTRELFDDERRRHLLRAGLPVQDGAATREWPALLAPLHRISAQPIPRSTRTEARRIPHHRSLKIRVRIEFHSSSVSAETRSVPCRRARSFITAKKT